MSDAPTKVGVLGARGRMGSQACKAIDAADGLELVAGVDIHDSLAGLTGAHAEVVVDFTRPDVVMDNLKWCIGHGVSAVVGTSGFTDERVEELREMVGDRDDVTVLIVPNFSIGAVLMMRFAAQAAPYFESAEVIELHHPEKVDAPSGTAQRTAELIAGARADAGCGAMPDATASDPSGARGGAVGGVPVHSVRARGLVAHQEVLLGALGETLTIRHDSLDRESFMPGVVAGVRAVSGAERTLTGVVVGLEHVLGF
ncbi:4-hydroxy-tetrahydrodipicolinate reductase [Solicola gregarius]|uniref:4-hydroxy-tetrahydrodipicolinate reductase n=1 Tax=Solicola gregarius TaxID=2908642 RepID=A0AA46TGR7_9ACTN|nr:4-hydroxy-tetrahydrodipicolinate reductase [Solicola gregarius]UYM04502.1 4-hydroxy-tetrahydrodipicolinate reductase [Solicola gregarius]